MNKLTIIGNLTRDPELRTTNTGLNVCSFTMAVNRKKAADGAHQVDYFRVTAWRQLGENCYKYLAKGRKVAVVGPVSVSTFMAKDGSGVRYSLDVTAEDVEFLTPKGNDNAPGGQSQAQYYEQVDDEDLPF